MIVLDIVWPYKATLMSLGTIWAVRGAMIVDLVMCKPRLAGSGSIMSSQFLKMVHLMTSVDLVSPFWIVLI